MTRISIGWVCGYILLSIATFTPAGTKKEYQHTEIEIKVFELTNEERKKKDLPALTLNPALSKIARAHAENMVRQGKMLHKLDDKDGDDRLRDAGYKFMLMAENLATGEEGATASMIMKAWMQSEGHRVNILGAEFTEMGVGVARAKDGQLYYTQMFAKPRKK